ncbi:MAG: hypothetical protein JJV90_00260, partial [Spiroplasma sp.]|nr:hypothetical protein [Mycoplasmatales bacterium]
MKKINLKLNYLDSATFLVIIADVFKIFEKHNLQIEYTFSKDYKIAKDNCDIIFSSFKEIETAIENKIDFLVSKELRNTLICNNDTEFLFEKANKDFNDEYLEEIINREGNLKIKGDKIFDEAFIVNELENSSTLICFIKGIDKEIIKEFYFAINQAILLLKKLTVTAKEELLNDLIIADIELLNNYKNGVH